MRVSHVAIICANVWGATSTRFGFAACCVWIALGLIAIAFERKAQADTGSTGNG
jgi:hypothetical protein